MINGSRPACVGVSRSSALVLSGPVGRVSRVGSSGHSYLVAREKQSAERMAQVDFSVGVVGPFTYSERMLNERSG